MKKFLIIAFGTLIAFMNVTAEAAHKLPHKLPIIKLPKTRTIDTDIYYGFKGLVKALGDLAIVKADVPGIEPQNITIEVTNNSLSIKAKREEEKEAKTKDTYRKEIFRGESEIVTLLPFPVNAEQATATLQDGVVTIELPKTSQKITKKVTIPVKKT
jgi:HSP20 family molecular chaperone IbpA